MAQSARGLAPDLAGGFEQGVFDVLARCCLHDALHLADEFIHAFDFDAEAALRRH